MVPFRIHLTATQCSLVGLEQNLATVLTANVMSGLVHPERYSNMPTADWYRVASNSSESSVAVSSFVPVATGVAAGLQFF